VKAALMPVMWMAQRKFGWISPEVISYIAEILSLPHSLVEGVASFYTMYFKKPMGRFHVQVCTNVSCMVCGGGDIFSTVKSKLGLNSGDVSPDGKFSLEEVECMGACGGAPMIAINEDFYENVDNKKVIEILDSLV
jgi:NADH-quinone oxidoreductase E subunit